jgi:hypothetical protein
MTMPRKAANLAKAGHLQAAADRWRDGLKQKRAAGHYDQGPIHVEPACIPLRYFGRV